MADDELEAIRAKRLAELQAQYGGQQKPEEQQKQAEAQRMEAEMKNSILTQILTQDARARLNSIALVKPEKAQAVEGLLIQMAKTGRVPGKLEEAELIRVLEQINQPKKTTVKFDRKKRMDEDSDED